MKIIHCADVHLDSRMTANLSKEKARERRNELLVTFTRMIEYAAEHGVDAVILAGDLFDTGHISAAAAKCVQEAIEKHPEIDFYYLRGNHDEDGFTDRWEVLPPNLKLFSEQWESYPADDKDQIRISGIELDEKNCSTFCHSLTLDADKINLVVLHGQETDTPSKGNKETISLRELRNKNIDYLALGHVHAYKMEPLDSRGIYCYPGCLEGRGFDECGEHGFVLLEIDETKKKLSAEFVPFAGRRLYTIYVDITGCRSTADILSQIRTVCAGESCDESSLIKVVLEGQVDVDCEKNLSYLEQSLQDEFYYLKIQDKSELKVDYEAFRLDQSLKGEFVRLVQGDDTLEEQEKSVIIRYGIQALAGEELEACN